MCIDEKLIIVFFNFKTMLRIIIVEENAKIGDAILKLLCPPEEKGELVCSNEQAYILYREFNADVIVLVNHYPDVLRVLGDIRSEDKEVFVLIKGNPIVMGEIELLLGLGADNYIVHFTPFEITAYLNAILRRFFSHNIRGYPLNERLYLSLENQRLYFLDHEQILYWRDFQVLFKLAKSKNKIVSSENLIRDCWPEMTIDTKTYLAKTIRRLRLILKKDPSLIIETIRGRGYRLTDVDKI